MSAYRTVESAYLAELEAAGADRRRELAAAAPHLEAASAALERAARAVLEARRNGVRVNMSAAAGLAGVARPTLYARVRDLEAGDA